MLAGVAFQRIGYAAEDLNVLFGIVALLWLLGHSSKLIGFHRTGSLVQIVAASMLLGLATSLASATLAVSALPYADGLLATLDSHLFFGFNWPAMIGVIKDWHLMLSVLSEAYSSLNWQPFLLVAVLCYLGRDRDAWSFLTASASALVICLAVFPWLPAQGAYGHYRISPDMVPDVLSRAAWRYPVILEGLRDGSIRELSAQTLTGIIAMPSFHAASAILLGWNFARIRILRIPGLGLNAAMLVSAVPIGGHYLIDILMGSLVGVLSIVLSSKLPARRYAKAGARLQAHVLLAGQDGALLQDKRVSGS